MRFSILTLLGLVAVAAIGTAALLKASPFWVSGLYIAALLLLGTSVVGSLTLDGRRRAFAIGFAVFGIGGFVLYLSPSNDQPGFEISDSLFRYVRERLKREVIDPAQPPSKWKSFEPKQQEFVQVCRTLTVIFCGLAGAWVGQYFYSLRQKQNAQATEQRTS